MHAANKDDVAHNTYTHIHERDNVTAVLFVVAFVTIVAAAVVVASTWPLDCK